MVGVALGYHGHNFGFDPVSLPEQSHSYGYPDGSPSQNTGADGSTDRRASCPGRCDGYSGWLAVPRNHRRHRSRSPGWGYYYDELHRFNGRRHRIIQYAHRRQTRHGDLGSEASAGRLGRGPGNDESGWNGQAGSTARAGLWCERERFDPPQFPDRHGSGAALRKACTETYHGGGSRPQVGRWRSAIF